MQLNSILVKVSLFLLLLTSITLNAQKKYSAGQLRADADFMINMMERTHINLYEKFPKAEFYRQIENVKASLKDSMTSLDLWKRIQPVIVMLGDGHTFSFMPQEERIEYLNKGGLVFPFTVKVDRDRIIVEQNFSGDPSIPPGSRILSINGINAEGIISEMARFESGERELVRRNAVAYSFNIYLWAVFGWTDHFTMSYEKPDGQRINDKTFAGITRERYKEVSGTAKRGEAYSLKLIENETVALIDFRSFSNMEKFSKFLKETFKTIKEKKINNLIIDVRNNPGGISILGDSLFSYITSTPFVQFPRADVRLGDTIRKRYGDNFPNIHNDTVLVFTAQPEKPQDKECKFHGKSYLLTSSFTFSSANVFASTFKTYKIGSIIGEETGGLTVAYGDALSYTAPNTKMRFASSYKKFWEAGGREDGHGVIPDYEVKQKIADTEKGVDTVFEFTLDLIRKDKR